MPSGRSGHRFRIRPVDLHPDRAFRRVELAAFQRLPNPSLDGLGREKLGHHHIGTEPPADLPEGGFGHSRHRSQYHRDSDPGCVW